MRVTVTPPGEPVLETPQPAERVASEIPVRWAAAVAQRVLGDQVVVPEAVPAGVDQRVVGRPGVGGAATAGGVVLKLPES
ncbi:MAG: hypothetical protein ACRD0F_10175 [Acidimicrobiales bacterium]